LSEHYYLRLLELGHFERRQRGGWRFGTKVISDSVADHLIVKGYAEITDNGQRLRRRRVSEEMISRA
jgi:hypothetical protein